MKKKQNRKDFPSFEKSVKACADFPWDSQSPEPLAALDYKKECALKDKAFCQFLSESGIRLKPKKIIPSPKPRNYRTTTKRRVFLSQNGIGLGFAEPVAAGVVAKSALEPEEHQEIYEYLQEVLSSKKYSPLAQALNWLIIRGNYDRQFLIINIFKMNSGVVKKLKQLSEELQKNKLVIGAMSYFDPSRSEYYLEAEKPNGLQVKHLFGQKLLGLKVGETLMRYSPTGFSQVNESMVPHMVNLAEEILAPEQEDHLLDLYCGYGLFSHTVGSHCQKVTGVELSSDAIQSAREIAKRLKTGRHMKFYSEMINAHLVRDKFDFPSQQELMLLDPPRNGCEPGVIAALAERKPKRVLQIFCGTDVVPKEIKLWQKNGYTPKTIQPIDMFPGTPNLETMVLFGK
ncbi:MAG: methyltransferase [Lentisphaerales bacterium]|nr:methyltransferase [Lentisphaerales bacterium]